MQRSLVDEAAVGSGDSRLRLTLYEGDPRPPHIGVVLTVPGLTAELSVFEHYTYAFDDLASYFTGLAHDWRGWSGVREWVSVESDLKLAAEFDPVGHVLLGVELRHNFPHWRASGEVSIDAGEDLSSAATEVAALASTYRRGRIAL